MTLPVALLIAQDSTKLSLLKRTLKNTLHLIERSDVKSALELLKTTHVDLVILDAKVQEGHIFKTAEEIRRQVATDTPILLITGNIKKSFIQTALHSGITDFINEPLDRNEIEQRVVVAFSTKNTPKKITQVARRSTPVIKSSRPLSEHAFLNDQAIKEIAKARKTSTMLSLLMIELNGVKKSSQTTQLKSVLQENLRKNDLLIPQGSGKFVLVLPKTSGRAAEIIAETLRSELKSFRLSVTMGLISLDKSSIAGSAADEFSHLLEAVRRATEKAKRK